MFEKLKEQFKEKAIDKQVDKAKTKVKKIVVTPVNQVPTVGQVVMVVGAIFVYEMVIKNRLRR